MNRCYDDILSLTEREPTWFDEHAVPRYCEFHPDRLSNVYATECCLMCIACQACGRQFNVAVSRDLHDRVRPTFALCDLIEDDQVWYGNPPNVMCCGPGPTMTSTVTRVIEYWRLERVNRSREWIRHPEFEREIDDS